MIQVIAAAAAVAVAAASAQTRPPAPKAEQERLIRKSAAKLKASLRERLLRGLNDPESARIRGEFLSLSDGDPPTVSLCGEINAKNRMGGYVGYGRFIVADDGQVILEDSEGKSFAYTWPVWCGDRIRE
jgi:hypothetical protein